MADRPSSEVVAALFAQREAFKGFLAARLGNAAEADDLLQIGLVKALAHGDTLREDEKLTSWFYSVLRRTLVDHFRSRQAARQRETDWVNETQALADDAEADRHICACFERLLPTLRPTHAELLRRVELQGEPVARAARALGLTPNNASVTLHRARAALRSQMTDFCSGCDCLENCDCD